MGMTAISEVFFFFPYLFKLYTLNEAQMWCRTGKFVPDVILTRGWLVCLFICLEIVPEGIGVTGSWGRRQKTVIFINVCKIAVLVNFWLVAVNSALLFQTTALGNSAMLCAVRVLSKVPDDYHCPAGQNSLSAGNSSALMHIFKICILQCELLKIKNF